MAEKNTTRIDKWLWAMRIIKTRSMSTKACARGKVTIDNITVKASRLVRTSDMIRVRKGVIKYEYKVLKIAEKRMGAKIIMNYMKEITPEEELVKLKTVKNIPTKKREKGKGRPTKKERRDIDKFREQY